MTFHPERCPADWKAIRAAILARADGRCECSGQCGDAHEPFDGSAGPGRCDAPHGERIARHATEPARWLDAARLHEFGDGDEAWRPTVLVVLTVAHLDHDEAHNGAANLAALCQRCHLQHDRQDNRRRASVTRGAKLVVRGLFDGPAKGGAS